LSAGFRLVAVCIDRRDDMERVAKRLPRLVSDVVDPGDVVLLWFAEENDGPLPHGDAMELARDVWAVKPLVRMLTWSASQLTAARAGDLPASMLQGVKDCRGGLGAFEVWARGHRQDFHAAKDPGNIPPDVLSGVLENYLVGASDEHAAFVTQHQNAANRILTAARGSPGTVALVASLLDDVGRQVSRGLGIAPPQKPTARNAVRKPTVCAAVDAARLAELIRPNAPAIADRLERIAVETRSPGQGKGNRKKSFAVFLSDASINILPGFTAKRREKGFRKISVLSGRVQRQIGSIRSWHG
jgi:hypothetical protein